MMKVLASAVVMLATVAAYAAPNIPQPMRRGFEFYNANPEIKWSLPPNRLHMFDQVGKPSNITEQQFNDIIDGVVKYFEPIVKAHGAKLQAEKAWNDSTVNASAYQSGGTWYLNMYGGLARRPEVTPDGFALVVCHELGHHLGGYTFSSGYAWAANEGQSDYFATLECAKVIWGRDFRGNEMFRRFRAPTIVESKCAEAWPGNTNAQGWCQRASAAGYSLATLLAALGGEKQPMFETPDQSVVSRTNNEHPKAQCRLDTYFAGALCTKAFDINTIPARNHPRGQTSAEAEQEAMKYSCFAKEGFKLGTRPLCWFKPMIN